MCSPAVCPTCKKVTWRGCGRHVDQVMRNVPDEQRCTCSERSERPASGVFSRLFRGR